MLLTFKSVVIVVLLLLVVGFGLFYHGSPLLPHSAACAYNLVWHHATWPGLRLLRHTGWILGNVFDQIVPGLLLGGLPTVANVHQLVQQYRVGAIVNLCVEFDGHPALYQSLGIEQLHVPTIDHREPSLTDLGRAIEFINRHRVYRVPEASASVGSKSDEANDVSDVKKSVLVHCRAGVGRSAAVVFCWLVAHGPMTMESAQAWLLAQRPCVRRTLHRQPTVRSFLTGRL